MQKKVSRFIIFIFLMLTSLSGHVVAQTVDKTPLISVIERLENKHQVQFSYVSEEIEGVMVVAPSEILDLEEALENLESQTSFSFNKINERYFSISAKDINETSICGKILNQWTGLPLENAEVIVGNNSFQTTTQADGLFYIPKQISSERIEIKFLGYEPLIVYGMQDETACETFLMQAEIFELNEVLLEHFLVRGIQRNLNGSTSMNTENFGLLPGQSQNDVLQMTQILPGVESSNETISTINIRGGTNDENLILWEGARMYQTGHFFGLVSAFNPYLTSQVEIHKNGTPAHFGESVSGVIDIKSTDKISEKIKGGIGLNFLDTQAFLDIPLSEKFGIQLSARTSINSIFETPVYENFTERIFQDTELTNNAEDESAPSIISQQSFNYSDLGAKLLWNASEKDRIRLSFLAIDNNLDFSERLTQLEQSKASKLTQQSALGRLSWQRKWSEVFASQAAITTSYYFLEALNRDVFTTQEIYQDNEVIDLGVQLDTQWEMTNNLQLESGYHFSEVGITNTQDVNLPRFRNFTKDVLRSHILHGMLNYTTENEKTEISAGARMIYFEKFERFLAEPRLHLYHDLGTGFGLELAGELKSQTTTQRIDFQSDFLGIEKRRWVLANEEDVPVKQSKQASFGLIYKENNWFINLEGFLKKVEGITSKSQGFQNQFQFSNTTGEYDVKGMELTINKKRRNFSGWISYRYNTNNYVFDTFEPSNFANNIDITHTATVAGTYDMNNWKFALGLNWHSGKPYTVPLAGAEIVTEGDDVFIQYDSPNAERLPHYLRLDFSGEYLWNISEKTDLKINFSLLNLLNEENTLNIRYALEETAVGIFSVKEIAEKSLGFTPNLAVQLLF